jgi:ankyrin repeat protein
MSLETNKNRRCSMKKYFPLVIVFLFLFTSFATSSKAKGSPCPGDSTGLVKAVIDRQIDKVKSLLNQGIRPDQRDVNCYTPLIWAGSQGDYEIVRLLLDKGADINAFNRDGHTALTSAVLNLALGEFKGRHIDVIKLLIERGANINWKSIDGTALKIAENFNLKEVSDILKKAGAKK